MAHTPGSVFHFLMLPASPLPITPPPNRLILPLHIFSLSCAQCTAPHSSHFQLQVSSCLFLMLISSVARHWASASALSFLAPSLTLLSLSLLLLACSVFQVHSPHTPIPGQLPSPKGHVYLACICWLHPSAGQTVYRKKQWPGTQKLSSRPISNQIIVLS